MALRRPLIKEVDGKWHMGTLEMAGIRGIMFQWVFGSESEDHYIPSEFHGYPAGLTAWPVLGMMLLNVGDGARLLESESLEEILSRIDRLGWGEPPHIDEVFKDAREVFQLLGSVLTGHSLKKEEVDRTFEEVLEELRKKWEALVDSSP